MALDSVTKITLTMDGNEERVVVKEPASEHVLKFIGVKTKGAKIRDARDVTAEVKVHEDVDWVTISGTRVSPGNFGLPSIIPDSILAYPYVRIKVPGGALIPDSVGDNTATVDVYFVSEQHCGD